MTKRKNLAIGINLRQIKGQEVMKKIISSGLFSFLGAALAVYFYLILNRRIGMQDLL